MRHASGILILFLGMTLCVSGCLTPKNKLGEGPQLNPPRIASDSTDLDIFFITLPEQTAETTFATAWLDADVQQISPEARQRQLANGLRAGVLGLRLPVAIQHLIEDGSQPLTDNAGEIVGAGPTSNMMAPADLEKMDRISIRRMAIRPHQRLEVVISREFENFPLLLAQDGQVTGGDFANAQGIFGVRATPVSGGKVRLEFDPELQYGHREQRISSSGAGSWKMSPSKQKVAMDSLAFACDLSPGEFVVIGSQPGRPGSVGDRFFEDNTTAEPRRKLLLIRLARSPGSELFRDLPNDAQ